MHPEAPSLPADVRGARGVVTPRQLEGRRAHTDWCCVTLLFQRVGEFGLECAANPRHGATEWAPVDPVPGGVAVNVGDMLSRWSDGRLLSNLHRVRMPKPKSGRARCR